MGKKKLWIGVFISALWLSGCGYHLPPGDGQSEIEEGGLTAGTDETQETQGNQKTQDGTQEPAAYVGISSTVAELESGFSAVRFEGEDGLEAFLHQGGAESDREVLQFLTGTMLGSAEGLSFEGDAFGCSTISVENTDGGYYFGRNFDWNKCDAMMVASYPSDGYASFSTVNVDFIRQGAGLASHFLSDEMLTVAALYAPLDGMNEKGLCVSVNMIQDSDTIAQNTEKPDITTTTAIRLLLNRAADVDEAVELLRQYDFHASMGYMVHLAIADSTGRSVAVEYVNNEMNVIETPILTNFYLSEGEKNGIGTSQSHTRFEILEQTLEERPVMDSGQVRDALSSVSKGNFGEFESTEWSVVFDQSALTAEYYHREDYGSSYAFTLFDD
ncbi:MAG: linear amide C-N hydrolase [Lachnospiraceae bacterium]|nr:linear amide C-N hydrolase [Lachnospiraceae bacterium]